MVYYWQVKQQTQNNKHKTTNMIKKIEKIHVGEDYTTYSYEDEYGEVIEVNVTGIAQKLINTLGEALMKESFLKVK